MATAPLAQHVPLETYLHTSYEPDVEYIEGELEERNVGEYEQNIVQRGILFWFFRRDKEWGIRTLQEQRTRLGPSRYRIPDISVFPRNTPVETVFTSPQMIAIEILSPDDSHSRMQARIEDFIRFGVKNIWVIDPVLRAGWDCSTGSWIRQERFSVKDTEIYLDMAELFLEIDQAEA